MTKRRLWQKLVSFITTFAVVLSSFGLPRLSFAAGFTGLETGLETASVTITGLGNGDKVQLYKFIKADYTASTNKLVYSFVAGLALTPDLTTYLGYQGTADEDANVNKAVAGYLKNNLGSLTKQGDEATAASGSVTIENVPIGSYIAVVTPTDDTTKFYNALVVNVQPGKDANGAYTAPANVTAAAKAGDVSITKTISPDYFTAGETADANFVTSTDKLTNGDVAMFKVVATLPNVQSTDANKSVTITDSSNQFSSAKIVSVSVTSNSTTTDITDTVTKATNDGGNLISVTISDASAYKNTNAAPPTVTILYKATFNSTQTEATKVYSEANTAKLTFTPDANYGTTTSTISNSVSVTVRSASFYKVDATNQTIKLAGAVFDIYEPDDSSSTTITVNEQNVKVRKVATGVTSDSDGVVAIKNLGTGTYYAKETTAPTNYSISPAILSMTVATSGETSNNNDATKGTQVAGNFTNTKTPLLPITGGAGTLLFTLIGGGLMATAFFIFVARRKKDEEEEQKQQA